MTRRSSLRAPSCCPPLVRHQLPVCQISTMASTRLLSVAVAVQSPLIRRNRRNPAISVARSLRPLRAFSSARRHSSSRCVVTMSASGRAGAVKETLGTEAYENLAGKQVYLVSTQEALDITSLWSQDDRAVLVFGRSMGVKRDVLPALREKGVKVYFISIGKPERGSEFVERTGFPADHLLADPDTVTYEALPFKKGVLTTLFNPKTPLSIWSRIKSGDVKDLGNMAKKFVKNKLWHPPKQDQAYQQGGVVIFEGKELLWAHYDPATGAHADLKEVVEVATDGL